MLLFCFADEARKNQCNVMVHCHAGVSRSATITIAYIMQQMNLSMIDAYMYVKNKRPIISPNLNFMGQLVEYEKSLNNVHSQQLPTQSQPCLIGIETSV